MIFRIYNIGCHLGNEHTKNTMYTYSEKKELIKYKKNPQTKRMHITHFKVQI